MKGFNLGGNSCTTLKNTFKYIMVMRLYISM